MPEPLPALPAAVEIAAYRIALEALNNVAAHAHAASCGLRVTHDGHRLIVEVDDDGRGIRTITGWAWAEHPCASAPRNSAEASR